MPRVEQLEQIRERMKNADEARRRIDDADDLQQASVVAAFVSERSSYDVPKLLKVIDEVLHTLEAWENYYDGHDIADAMVFSLSRSVRGSMKRALK